MISGKIIKLASKLPPRSLDEAPCRLERIARKAMPVNVDQATAAG